MHPKLCICDHFPNLIPDGGAPAPPAEGPGRCERVVPGEDVSVIEQIRQS
jgi:hypothetical protein